ncbi:MAG: hypothetical protein KDA84_26200, partial [Planctomycetaceae bacterium]|nr:hypothetical protein [Planctomycetaceae bacterium]
TGVAGGETVLDSKALESEFGPPQPTNTLSFTEAVRRAGMEAADLALAYKRTAFGLEEMERWRSDGTYRLQEAQRFQQLAEALEKQEIQPGEQGAESLTSD